MLDIPTKIMIWTFLRGDAEIWHFLEARRTVMVKYSNGRTMSRVYRSIMLSLNVFCLWVRPLWALILYWDSQSSLSPSYSFKCITFEQIERTTIKKKDFPPYLLGPICFYHQSIQKPQWWVFFLLITAHQPPLSPHLFKSLLYASTALYSLLMGQGVWCPLAWRWHLSLTAQRYYKYQAQVPCGPTFWQL